MAVARMDDRNRAPCFVLRSPPSGQEVTSFNDIRAQKLVFKKDGTIPSVSVIKEAADSLHDEKATVGRKVGWRKTNKAEDKKLLSTFHKVRPKGHGVTARRIHTALPKAVRDEIGKRTFIRRVAAKGYVPKVKLRKQDFSVT